MDLRCMLGFHKYRYNEKKKLYICVRCELVHKEYYEASCEFNEQLRVLRTNDWEIQKQLRTMDRNE